MSNTLKDATFDEIADQILQGFKEAAEEPQRANGLLVVRSLILFAITLLWGTGVVVAKGFLWTLVCIFIPFVGPGTAVAWLVTTLSGGAW